MNSPSEKYLLTAEQIVFIWESGIARGNDEQVAFDRGERLLSSNYDQLIRVLVSADVAPTLEKEYEVSWFKKFLAQAFSENRNG